MPTTRKSGQKVPDRHCHAAPVRSDLSLAAGQSDAPQWTVGTVPVGFLAAHEHDQDVAVLSVHGEVDLETAPALWKTLLPALEHQTGPVVVDLSAVTFMDSTGVHALVDARRRLALQNRRLAIVCRDGGQVHRLLALVGLLDALAVYRSRESAVIGGDDVIRSEPDRNGGRPSGAGVLTRSHQSARQTHAC
jgi:anti-sigma B factor antagonist